MLINSRGHSQIRSSMGVYLYLLEKPNPHEHSLRVYSSNLNDNGALVMMGKCPAPNRRFSHDTRPRTGDLDRCTSIQSTDRKWTTFEPAALTVIAERMREG